MINELLNNQAYMRLYKNATSLNEVAAVSSDFIPNVPATLPMIISAAKPTAPPPLNTATVINTDVTNNKGGGNLLLYIGVGLLVCIAAYNIYDHYNQKNKSIKL
jgi:hypothetical protein